MSAVRGASLAEMLVAVTVLLVLAVIGIPLYGGYSREDAVSSLSSGLVAALNDARSRAAAERKPVRVRAIGGDWRNGWQTVRINKSNDPTDDDVLFTDRRTGDEDDVTIAETASSLAVDFDPEGRVAGARRFAIALAGGERGTPMRVLAINAIGRIAVDPTPHP